MGRLTDFFYKSLNHHEAETLSKNYIYKYYRYDIIIIIFTNGIEENH